MLKEHQKIQKTYPYDEWQVVEEAFTVENNYKNETIFALANGYIGWRGNPEEGYTGPKGSGLEGTYINGFYESEIIKYPEIAYGFAEKSQTMLNVTNGKIIQLFLENEEFDMLRGKVEDYRRVLDLRTGVLTRSLKWTSPLGKSVRIKIERLVSLASKSLAAISYEVTPLDFRGTLRLVSALDGDVTNLTVENDPRVGSGLKGRVLSVDEKRVGGSGGFIKQTTSHTRFSLVCAMENHLEASGAYTVRNETEELKIRTIHEIQATPNQTIRLDKFVAYTTTRDCSPDDVVLEALETAARGKTLGFAALKSEQSRFLADFWEKADIEIEGDVALQQGLRFNIFHLLQSVGRDGRTNIGAKGLTGEGYEGHYFWDTEIYVLPFFLYNNPDISRKLLEYRYSTLDKARERARQLSHPRGALFPWRTIGGEECSSYFPAGTAQYHINADVAFAVKKYMEATDDLDFLTRFGGEILFETARLWADLGDFIPHKNGQFCINEVTGPDEYTALVNNNCYTNLMAKTNMEYAAKAAARLKKDKPQEYRALAAKLGLGDDEIAFWKKAAGAMYLPRDTKSGLYLQDDQFLDRAKWDFENTPADKYPLLIHYHPLVIYRYQVCKQADLVLALFLQGERFTLEEKRVNFDFYEGITTHDSSLSTCIFSIMASEIGYHEKAYKYFMSTARMDIDDYHKNTKHGIHAANMAGAWMAIVNGFAGMRVFDETLHFQPHLPEGWSRYSFPVTFRGSRIKITVEQNAVTYTLLAGPELKVIHRGESVTVTQKHIARLK